MCVSFVYILDWFVIKDVIFTPCMHVYFCQLFSVRPATLYSLNKPLDNEEGLILEVLHHFIQHILKFRWYIEVECYHDTM